MTSQQKGLFPRCISQVSSLRILHLAVLVTDTLSGAIRYKMHRIALSEHTLKDLPSAKPEKKNLQQDSSIDATELLAVVIRDGWRCSPVSG